jgi:hypothetical protein
MPVHRFDKLWLAPSLPLPLLLPLPQSQLYPKIMNCLKISYLFLTLSPERPSGFDGITSPVEQSLRICAAGRVGCAALKLPTDCQQSSAQNSLKSFMVNLHSSSSLPTCVKFFVRAAGCISPPANFSAARCSSSSALISSCFADSTR